MMVVVMASLLIVPKFPTKLVIRFAKNMLLKKVARTAERYEE